MSDKFDSIQADIDDPKHQRRGLRMLRQGLEKGWIKPVEIPDSLINALPGVLASSIARSAKAGNERSLVSAVQAVTSLMKINLEIAKAADHDTRLDSGDPTDVTSIKIIDETPDE